MTYDFSMDPERVSMSEEETLTVSDGSTLADEPLEELKRENLELLRRKGDEPNNEDRSRYLEVNRLLDKEGPWGVERREPETPETPKTLDETEIKQLVLAERNLYEVALKFYQTRKVPNKLATTREYFGVLNQLDDARRGVSIPRADLIINTALEQVYHLPDSLLISEKALKHLEEETKNLQFPVYSKEEIDGVLKQYLNGSDYDYLLYSSSDFFVFAVADNEIVGCTECIRRNNEIRVSFQMAKGEDHPGVGLAMLREVINRARDEGSGGVSLITPYVPWGLGNLGFDWRPNRDLIPEYAIKF